MISHRLIISRDFTPDNQGQFIPSDYIFPGQLVSLNILPKLGTINFPPNFMDHLEILWTWLPNGTQPSMLPVGVATASLQTVFPASVLDFGHASSASEEWIPITANIRFLKCSLPDTVPLPADFLLRLVTINGVASELQTLLYNNQATQNVFYPYDVLNFTLDPLGNHPFPLNFMDYISIRWIITSTANSSLVPAEFPVGTVSKSLGMRLLPSQLDTLTPEVLTVQPQISFARSAVPCIEQRRIVRSLCFVLAAHWAVKTKHNDLTILHSFSSCILLTAVVVNVGSPISIQLITIPMLAQYFNVSRDLNTQLTGFFFPYQTVTFQLLPLPNYPFPSTLMNHLNVQWNVFDIARKRISSIPAEFSSGTNAASLPLKLLPSTSSELIPDVLTIQPLISFDNVLCIFTSFLSSFSSQIRRNLQISSNLA